MESLASKEVKGYNSKRKKHFVWIGVFACLAVVVTIGTIAKLRYTGQAMNRLVCEVKPHTHTASCYDENSNLICGKCDYLIHTHNDSCYDSDGNLVCPLAEISAHNHVDGCYSQERILVCQLEESVGAEVVPASEGHTHSDDCYAEESVLVCEEEHEHTEECYQVQQVLVCELEESEATEAVEEIAGHTHDDSCYAIVATLSCGLNALHQHTSDCYDGEGQLVCGQLELFEHIHDEACIQVIGDDPAPESTNDQEAPADEVVSDDQPSDEPSAQTVDEQVDTPDQSPEEDATVSEPSEEVDDIDPADETVGDVPEDTDADDINKEETDVEDGDVQNPEEEIVYFDGKMTAVCDGYVITVVVKPEAKIPAEAELSVKHITKESDSELYAKMEEELKSSTENSDAVLDFLFDVCFIVNGKEIEPESGVKVTIKLLEEETENSGDEMTIIHFKDDETNEVFNDTPINENDETSFELDSFSLIGGWFNNRWYDVLGVHGNFTATENTTKDAFTSGDYGLYYNPNSALGVAGNFHVVAFELASLGTHTNGNVLAKKAIGSANFGTNNYENELSYIQEMWVGNGTYASKDNHVLVLGSNNEFGLDDNGNALKINGTKVNKPRNIIIDKDTSVAPFIDLAGVKREVTAISDSLASHSTTNVNTSYDWIKITDTNAAGYWNIHARDLGNYSGDLKLGGFVSGQLGSLIINIDCSGMKVVELPDKAHVYIDGNMQNPNEVTTFEAGKVIWNFRNCNGVTINTHLMTGIILAPGAEIHAKANLNGTIVGDRVYIEAETHRTDFTGTTVPFSAGISGIKKVDGSVPSDNQVFDFKLEELKDNGWNLIQSVKNTAGSISFSNITYKDTNDIGEHWYRISETPDSATSGKYTYDDTQYVVKVVVSFDAGTKTYTAVDTTYLVKDNDKLLNGSSINTSVLGQISGKATDPSNTGIAFNNGTETFVSVEKKWVNQYGEELKESLPTSITVDLFRTVDANANIDALVADANAKIDTINLTAADGWKKTVDSLPSTDANGSKYYYYFKETSVIDADGKDITADVEATYSTTTPISSESTETITNMITIPEYVAAKVIKVWTDHNGVALTETNKFQAGVKVYRTTNQYDSIDAARKAIDKLEVVKDASGNELVANLTANNNFEAIFENLDKYTKEKLPYYYYIFETSVKDFEGKDITEFKASYKVDVDAANAMTTITITNKKDVPEPEFTNLSVDKKWFISDGKTPMTQNPQEGNIKFELRQIVWIDGEKANVKTYGEYEIGAEKKEGSPAWSLTINMLPAKEYIYDEDADVYKVYTYTYFVVETECNVKGTYVNCGYENNDTEKGVIGSENHILVFNKNNDYYELPETGGMGNSVVYAAGALIMMIGAALLVYKKKSFNLR